MEVLSQEDRQPQCLGEATAASPTEGSSGYRIRGTVNHQHRELDGGTRPDEKEVESFRSQIFASKHFLQCKCRGCRIVQSSHSTGSGLSTRVQDTIHSQHITRLKSGSLHASRNLRQFWHSLLQLMSLLLTSSISFHKHRQLGTTMILILGLLFVAVLHPAAATTQADAHSQQQPHSWVIADLESRTSEASDEGRTFQFPDFVIPANFLFQYQVPEEAFSTHQSEANHHYQVQWNTDLYQMPRATKYIIFTQRNFNSDC